MSKRKRQQQKMKKRVIQRKLPTEHISYPRGGDWSCMEATARRQLAASAKRISA